ncbi:MAG: UvrD-helicase domain-containing protein [Burkholderiales bacterium]|nr:UvrD-helicase domain-containing protein [Burkholderiales bacterium]
MQQWVCENIPAPQNEPAQIPDLHQAAAIGAIQTHAQIVARAGSGKTETLANRAAFLQKHCGVAPGEMLYLHSVGTLGSR